MKKKWLLGLGLLGITGVLLLSGCTSTSTTSTPTASNGVNSVTIDSQQRGIQVSAEGKVYAAPDLATLNLGVSAQADTVAAAQSQATDAMNKVMAALKNEGVADKDIQTQNFSIQKQTRWDSTKQVEVVTGYLVSNQVTVKVRNIPDTGTIIDAVTNAGGDLIRINNISFSIEDPTQYYDQARTAAMQSAKQKATQLASLAGVTLGAPIYINESQVSSPPIYADTATLAAAPKAATPISPGQNEISLNVQVTYAIK